MNDPQGVSLSPVFEREFPVLFHDLDFKGHLGPETLLNFMQTSAIMHSLALGVSATNLRPQGLTWVISRIHLVIERYPRAREIVALRTWPAVREGLFTNREFELNDGSGHPLARATTSWALINIVSRRPVKLEGNLPPYPLLPRRAVDDNFAPLPLFPGSTAPEVTFRVLRGDLDLNHHVNNTVYARWALEAVPDEVAAGNLTELEISFRAEVLYGETVVSRCAVQKAETAICCLHQIINKRDNRELARLRTRWRSTKE
ncbi:MAG: acyl-ACP thioesterase [Desulfuromonadales bacterium]|nr:acyl-ACP thioesterase [Desulfuromonadales bacterium]